MKKYSILIIAMGLGLIASGQRPVALETLLDSARARNSDVRIMKSRYQQAQVSPAAVAGIDATGFSFNYGQVNGPANGDYQLQIIQPLGNPVKGIYERRKRDSEVELAFTELGLQGAYLDMSVEKAYAQWSTAYQKYELRKLQKTFYDSATASSQRLFDLGEINTVEWGLSQSRMMAAKEMYFSAYTEYTNSRQQLEALCRMKLEGFVPDDTPGFSISLVEIDGTGGKLQQQRLSIQQDVAEKQLAVSGAAMAPSFSIGYLNQKIDGVVGYQGVVAGVSIPLLKMGNYKERKIARFELEQAEINRENQSFRLARQIEMLEAQKAIVSTQLVENGQFMKEDLEKSLASSLRLFKSGEIDFIQLSQIIDGLVDGFARQQNLYYQLYSINSELKYLTK